MWLLFVFLPSKYQSFVLPYVERLLSVYRKELHVTVFVCLCYGCQGFEKLPSV